MNNTTTIKAVYKPAIKKKSISIQPVRIEPVHSCAAKL